jgi:hypothetical protein
MTSLHRISAYDDDSEPKKTCTGSDLEKFSPYNVNIFVVGSSRRLCPLGASEARSGGRYLTTPGKGVTGLEGMGNELGCCEF